MRPLPNQDAPGGEGQPLTDQPALPRRRFLQTLGLGAGAVGLTAATGGPAAAQRGGLDLAVLNFALNLEYLEAEYYALGVFGQTIEQRGIPTTGINTGGGNPGALTVKANPQVPFVTPLIRQYAEEIAADEIAHVAFLRRALGDNAVARPAVDLLNSFNAAARAAGLGDGFDPFLNETNFLIGAFVFEDVGVTAYKGAARLIANRDFLEAAAGILAVEAYHASEVRTVLATLNAANPNAGIAGIVQAISNLRDAADGAADLDQGIFDPAAPQGGNAVNIVPTDADAIAFSRTAQQVLNIVYLNPNGTPGGFLPSGANGQIR